MLNAIQPLTTPFNVGMQLFLERVKVSSAQRHRSVLRGWRENESIIVDHPMVGDHYVHFTDGEALIVRFLHFGRVCAFETYIKEFVSSKNSTIHIAYPSDVKELSLRKQQRISVNVLARVSRIEHDTEHDKVTYDEFTSRILDLSADGCLLRTNERYELGAALFITFLLPNGVMRRNLRAVVRNTRKVGPDNMVGVEFDDPDEAQRREVGFFVRESLKTIDLQEPEISKKILVVDDITEDIRILRYAFEKEGFVVASAGTALDAFAKIRSFRPDVVICDTLLPDLNGFELCRVLRNHREFESLPVVFISSQSDAATQDQARDVGATGFHSKPIKTLELVNSVAATTGTQGEVQGGEDSEPTSGNSERVEPS